MKKRKIFALILAVVMICMAVASCADSTPKVKVTATFTVIVDGNAVVNEKTMEVEGTKDSAPTVLAAICDVLEEYGMIPEYAENSLTAVMINGVTYATGDDGAWFFTINGEDGTRAGQTVLSEGDVIVYTYS